MKKRLILFVDTNVLDDESETVTKLWELHAQGIVELRRTSAMDRDLDSDSRPGAAARRVKADELRSETGTWVLGVSRLGIDTKLGDEVDVEGWNRLWPVLNPGRRRPESRGQHHRDALHIYTAIRAGGRGFITRDGSGKRKGLLDRAEPVATAFNGFMLCTPEKALELIKRETSNRTWKTCKYRVSDKDEGANWFSVEDFAAAVDRPDSPKQDLDMPEPPLP